MMQDFPTVLNADECKKVGFTQVAAELCFSPVKNSVADGAALQEKCSPPGSALTGEADQYTAQRIMMRARGCKVEDAAPETYNGVTAIVGPCIVLKPDFVCCPGEYETKFPTPDKVKISSRSTLIVRGPGVIVESLDLDGALIIDVERGEEAIVRDLVVKNDGWVRHAVTETTNELVAMRGFKIERKDQKNIEVRKEVAPEDRKKEDESDGGSEWVETQETGSSGCIIS
jgi:UDP-sugar pyrophosphorylase